MRLKEGQVERLKRMGRRYGKSASQMGAVLLEEGLREAEFPYVEFRDSAAGRQAYIKGRRTQVWMLVMVARDYDMDPEKTAEHFQWPIEWVKSGFGYAEAFPDEIEAWIEENNSYDEEKTRKLLPRSDVGTFYFSAAEPVQTRLE